MIFLASSVVAASGAGISTDGSMGPAATLSGPHFIIPASLGTQVGGNLFHSFGQFNLLNEETAEFTATGSTATINNIIARVTGGTASSIDGTIESSIPGANLFFLNASGVMFGADAHVNVSGAFTVGTPNYVKLADGTGKFSTSLGGNDVLTSADISAFGFLSRTPQPVQFNQSDLAFATGANVTVIGGDITLTGATLSAPAGNVSFYSAGSSGEVAITPAQSTPSFGPSSIGSLGNVTLQSAAKIAIDSAQGGGSVVIRGGTMVFQNQSHVTSLNTGPAAGGSVEVDATALSFLDNSNVLTATSSSGAAGNIDVAANSLTIDGSANPSNLFSNQAGLVSVCNVGAGNSGHIAASVSEDLNIEGSGEIATETFAAGRAGAVSVQAATISIDGSALPQYFTGISSTSEATSGKTVGDGGVVSVQADNVSIKGGGAIVADTFSAGAAGGIDLVAKTLTIDGSGEPAYFTGISSNSESAATGNGGTIILTLSGALTITGTGEITTSTFGAGNAGNIIMHAGSLDLDSESVTGGLTGIGSQVEEGSTGAGGDIDLTVTGLVKLVNSGQISADTRTAQTGGNIVLHADSLLIDGSNSLDTFTGISASTAAAGQGGNLTVSVDQTLSCTGGGGIEEESFSAGNSGVLSVVVGKSIELHDGGFISGDTFANGNGGTVTVSAASVAIDGSGPVGASSPFGTLTGIASDSNAHFQSTGTGNGGSVNVTATNSLTLTNGGEIAALTETQGNAGEVVVNAPGSISLSGNGSQISSASTGMGIAGRFAGTAGGVTIHAGTLQLDNRSNVATSAIDADAGSIFISAGRQVTLANESSITTSAGANGGSIELHVAELVYLIDSSITATAGTLKEAGVVGSGGNITIDPQFVVLDHSLISADAALGEGGNILIVTSTFLNDASLLTATGSTDGTITISAPNVDLSGSLLGLPATLVDNAKELRESCARAMNHEFSSLTVVGRTGVEVPPDEPQSDSGSGIEASASNHLR